MASLELEIDASKAVDTIRKCVADELASLVRGAGYSLPVILRLLRDDSLARILLAEAMFVEHEAAIKEDRNDPDFETHEELSYDDMARRSVNALLGTIAGR